MGQGGGPRESHLGEGFLTWGERASHRPRPEPADGFHDIPVAHNGPDAGALTCFVAITWHAFGVSWKGEFESGRPGGKGPLGSSPAVGSHFWYARYGR